MDSAIQIHMTGLTSSLKQATLDNLKPRIDIGELEPGEHNVSVILEEISNVKISGDRTIKIIVEEENSQTEED